MVKRHLKGVSLVSIEACYIVKLRGHPKAFTTKLLSKDNSGRVNYPGYSQNVKDVTMDNLQPSPKD